MSYQDETQKKLKKLGKMGRKKQPSLLSKAPISDSPCFVCGEHGDVGSCHNKNCNKFYHLKCVDLTVWPEGEFKNLRNILFIVTYYVGKWICSWHSCNVCSKRTIRCCVKCINSFCPVHSEGNIRHDNLMGFVCSKHDPVSFERKC